MISSSSRLRQNLWFAYLCLLLFWSANAYFEILNYLRQGKLFTRVIDGHPYISDTVQWYNAAVLGRKCLGGPFNIYDPNVQDQSMRAITAPVFPEGFMYLQYPPQFFALVLPFAALPITPAYFAWCGLSLILICITLWYLVRHTLKPGFQRVFATVGVFSSFPAWLSFEMGQTSLFQNPVTIAFWLLLALKKYFLCGLISAFLLVKLQYMPFFVLVGIILGRWRYCLGLSVSTALLALPTMQVLGWQNIERYPQALLYGETNPSIVGVMPGSMQNLRGEMILLAGAESKLIHTVIVGIFGLALLLVAILWWKLYPRLQQVAPKYAFGVLAAITILLSIIVSPHTHMQEFLTATTALIFLYPFIESSQPSNSRKALTVLVISYPILSWFFYLGMFASVLIKLQPFFAWTLAVLLLTAQLIRERLRVCSESANPGSQ